MNEIEIYKMWISKAENDIKNIQNNLTFKDDEIPIDTVCFHCQQAIEKYLNAYLIANKMSNYFCRLI